jgi:hypothetical protein
MGCFRHLSLYFDIQLYLKTRQKFKKNVISIICMFFIIIMLLLYPPSGILVDNDYTR